MIRKATPKDVPLLSHIEKISFAQAQYPIDEESFHELLADPAQLLLVYEDDAHKICGHLLAEHSNGTLSIDSVAVLPECRHKGIGKALVQAALDHARTNNLSASLETPENNTMLRTFYESLRFKVTGRQDNFYGDGSACLLMKLAFAFLLLLPLPVLAQEQAPISLQLPVACKPGNDCWLVNYPDSDDAADSAKDFTCGPLTYDTHDGSDVGILDLVSMEKGVNVLAAADGKILRLRDGAEDTMPTKDDISRLMSERKGCGNGIVIEHQNGWQTLYCHMKKGSFRVKQGQAVKAGDPIGLVGHSGIAEFPHLHFTVMKDGAVYDPFTGHRADAACGGEMASLWNPPLSYEPVSLYAAGFKAGVPNMDALRIDAAAAPELRRGETDALTFWAMIYGAAQDDKIAIEIIGPNDEVIARRDITQEKTRARQFYYVGKRFGERLAPAGEYTGIITLTRTDASGETLVRTRNATARVN